MLDHLGLTSADLARSKTFFLQALAPLQIGVVMEVSAEQTGDHDHIGFGSDGKPFFWLGNGGTASHGVHVAFACASRAQVDAFHAAALAARVVDAPSLRIGAAGGPFVLDVVYADWPTAFARTMSARGATVVSGLDMLVHQAAAQFELFTGHTAPIADMMEAGRAAVK